MDSARFSRIEALVDGALEQPPDLRAAWLERACAGDTALRADAAKMLADMDASEGFLEGGSAPAAAGIDLCGQVLGPWRLLRSIGSGGSGEVWLAERADGRYRQNVAVKLLRHWRNGLSARFEREQAMLARLEHPGIARLLDAGSTPEGQPYMVMEYIEGLTLIEHCQAGNLSLAARLALFGQVCEAVAYAHRHLVVHSDLKPQNILVRADGRVALLDFGIARLLDMDDAAAGEPHTRAIRLTPRYAAPEQLAGDAYSTLADVYTLGLLLHEMLTSRSPWGELTGQGAMAVMRRAMAGPPPAPSSQASGPALARSLRGDLDAIVGKALRPEPEQRYASVDALREDLQRYRRNEPVRARGDAFAYRFRRGLRRYRVAVAVALVVAASVIGGVASTLQAQREAERERDLAQIEATRAKAVRDALAHMFRDAGQEAGDGASLTAGDILGQAAERIQAGFDADPATGGQVLHALGELHLYINDYAGAEPLLRKWLENESAIRSPDTAADVRSALAEALYRMGKVEESAQLLHRAQSYWQADPGRYGDRLLTSRMLQSQLERQRGDVALGIETLEASLPIRLQRSGREHFETAALYSNLGAAYIQAGRIEEGLQASQEAMVLWRALGLDNGNDALNTLNNLAAAHFRTGDLARAAENFERALQIRRQVHGPSAATAALIGNHARVMQKQDRLDEALALLDEAEPMALAHAGPGSVLTLSIQLTRAEVLVALERVDEAAPLLASLQAAALPPPLQERVAQALAAAESP